MNDYYDAETHDEYVEAMQRRINDGSIWKMEGSAGRGAMSLIEQGLCMLGTEGHRDFWGNYVPSRDEVKPGTKGSYDYVAGHTDVDHADRMATIPAIQLRGEPA